MDEEVVTASRSSVSVFLKIRSFLIDTWALFYPNRNFYIYLRIFPSMANKRVISPQSHTAMHIAERDSKNYTKGQFTGRFKNKKKE